MKQNMKVKISLYISIIGLLFLVVGSSFALLQDSKTSTKNQIIQTGAVKLKLSEESSGITVSNLQSLTDAEGFLQETYYDFSIKNIGDTTAEISVLLIDDPSKTSDLDATFIRVGLEVNNEKVDVMNLEDVERIINERVIKKHETVKYRLRLWVDYDKYNNSDVFIEENSTISLKIKVNAIQYVGEEGVTVFNYTGDYQEYVVPQTGYYNIEAYGAEGGSGMIDGVTTYVGGKGGYSSGKIFLTEGEKLYIYVGSKGGDAKDQQYGGTGGYNGGGTGGTDTNYSSSGGNEPGGAGGGASDIRYFGSTTPTEEELVWNSTLGLNSRILVAGGGGGAEYYGNGGAGGSLYAGASSSGTSATQTSGNAFGVGLTGVADTDGSGGGGGGYYGGTTAANNTGGGGSSFISGYAGANAITSSADRTHTNNTIHYSEKYFIDGKMESGVNSGDGSVSITYIGKQLERTNTKLNNVRYVKDCINGNNANAYNHWIEIQAIKNGKNVAKDKAIIATTTQYSTNHAFSYITDGQIDNITGSSGFGYSGTASLECMIIDLEEIYDLDEIAVWHYYPTNLLYYDNITYVSSDNSTWTEVINTEVAETSNGKKVTAWDVEVDDNELIEKYTKDNLILWYDGIKNTTSGHNDSSAIWYDLSGSENNGTLYGGTWGNKYLRFDGSDDYVLSANNLGISGDTNFTMCAVAEWRGTAWSSDYPSYMGTNINTTANALSMTMYGGKPALDFWNYRYQATTALSIDNKYQICLTKESGSISTTSKIYVNGEIVAGSGNSTSSPNITNAQAVIGRLDSTRYANANIYSVRYYSKTLSIDEIKNDFYIDNMRFDIE